jgi:hypothetical protein
MLRLARLTCRSPLGLLSVVQQVNRFRIIFNKLIDENIKIFFFKDIFFQIVLLLTTDTIGWISALYMESTENVPLSYRFHQNSSVPTLIGLKLNAKQDIPRYKPRTN